MRHDSHNDNRTIRTAIVPFLFLALLLATGPLNAQEGDNTLIEINTSLGKMVAELNPEEAPETVVNVLQYVDDGFYEKTIFHRIIDGFMIQGGGYSSDMARKETRDPVQNEANNGLKNTRGTLVMARTGDPHSATAQFFINHKDNAFLDYPAQDGWGYAVFGRLVSGEDVLDKIAAVETGPNNVPTEPIIIHSIKRISEIPAEGWN